MYVCMYNVNIFEVRITKTLLMMDIATCIYICNTAEGCHVLTVLCAKHLNFVMKTCCARLLSVDMRKGLDPIQALWGRKGNERKWNI